MEKYLYIGMLVFAISYPLAQSFEHRIRYASNWFALLPALFISAIIFIIWDAWFTQLGVWEFNPRYVLGKYIFGLPIEEILFFLVIPFACIFIYEVLIYFFPKDIFQPLGKPFVNITVPLLLGLGFIHVDKWYTAVCFIFAAVVILSHFMLFHDRYLGRFIFAYLVHLVPFILCNGLLTGGVTDEPVVIYNNAENLGIRIWTVPIEDAIYSMSLLLLNITLFEKIRGIKTINKTLSL